jgi:ABC-type phosphate transport system substrate-binding protein
MWARPFVRLLIVAGLPLALLCVAGCGGGDSGPPAAGDQSAIRSTEPPESSVAPSGQREQPRVEGTTRETCR